MAISNRIRGVVQSYIREGASTKDAIRQARLWAKRMESRRKLIAAAKLANPLPEGKE